MFNLLANRFVDFLTAKIGETPIPIWVALTAIAVMIIIIAIIIGVSTGKSKKKAKSKSDAVENQAVVEVVEISEPESVEEFVFDTIEDDYLDPSQVADKPQDKAVEEPFISFPKEIETAEKKHAEEKILTQNSKPIVVEDLNAPLQNSNVIENEPIIPIATPIAKPIAKPMVKVEETIAPVENKPVELPTYSLDTKESKTIAKPITKPIAKKVEEDQPIVAEKTTPEISKEIKPAAKTIAKPVAKPVAKPIAKKVEESKPIAKPIAKKVEEIKPVAKVAPKVEEKKIEEEIPLVKILDDEKESTFGKYVITEINNNPMRPYAFSLIANNGQLLFESESFKVKPRETSITAFKKLVKEGIFVIDEDKQGTFRYKLYNAKNVLIGVGETYKSRSSCESSIESVKRFSESATVIEDKTSK